MAAIFMPCKNFEKHIGVPAKVAYANEKVQRFFACTPDADKIVNT